MAFFSTIAAIAAKIFTAKFFLTLAVNVGLQLLTSAFRKKPKTDTGAIDAGQMVRASLDFGIPRHVLMGQRDQGGVETDRFSYGTKNEWLVGVFVLSSRPCTGFVGLKVFGEPVTLSGDPTTGERAVTSHFLGRNNEQRMYVRVFLGDDNSGFPGYMNSMMPGRYDSSDVGGNMCIAVWRARHTNDDIDDDGKSFIPWTNGPPDARWEMKGMKLYDPREPGSDPDDRSTWVYSENGLIHDLNIDLGIKDGAADTANEQVTIGNGYPIGLLDLDHVEVMANWKDGRLYESHGVIRSGQRGDQEEVWKTFNGQRLERPASVLTMPEAARPFYGTIDLSEMPAAKVVEYNEHGESTEVLNRLYGFYTEPQEGYGRKDLPFYTRDEWIVADNFIKREDELGLHFVTNADQGLELLKQEAELTRHPATLTITGLKMSYGQTPVGELVDLLGTDIPSVNGRRWVVESVLMSALGPVSISFREWPGDSNLVIQPTDPTPLPPTLPTPRPWPWFDPDGIPTVAPRIVNDLNGVLDGTRAVADVNIAGRGSLVDDFDGLDGNFNRVITGQAEITDLRIAGKGSLNQANDSRDADIAEALSSAASASGELSGTKSPSQANGSSSNPTGSITTNTVRVTPAGGTGPYTHSWSAPSGSVLTISDTTSVVNGVEVSDASFTGTPGPAPSSIEETWTDTITDSSSPAKSVVVQVPVSIVRFQDFGGGGGGIEDY